MTRFADLFPMYNETHMLHNTNENQVKLNISLVNAIKETKDIHADSTNPFHKSKYASLAAHLEALKPIFAKHDLAILQFPIGHESAVGVRTIIIHVDGASISSDALIPAEAGMTGQQAGAIISYLRRYSLASVAGVATEDDDAESDRVSRPAPVASASPKAAPKAQTKYIPNPNAELASTGKGQSSAVAPFGDAKGTPLSALPLKSDDRSKKCADLSYWATVWEPRPFGDTGKISAKDQATKFEAVRLWNEAHGTGSSQPETTDEVPF
jgi:hypothetical protein